MLSIIAHSAFTVTLLAVVSSLTPVYIVSLVAGGGLLIFSLLSFGGTDSDADVDAGGADLAGADDADLDGGADLADAGQGDLAGAGSHDLAGSTHAAHGGHGALALSKWLSRFCVYFGATFGLLGTVLSYMSDLPASTVAAWAVVGGLLVGQVVHQTIRALQRTEGNSAPRASDFADHTARVTRPLNPGVFGEVSVSVGDQEFFLPAQPQRPDDHFAVGDIVVIAEYQSGTAKVLSRREHEFLKT